MKTLHPNLAARPYRDTRPLWAAVFLMAVASAILLVYNVQTGWEYLKTTRETRDEIAALESRIASERNRASQLRAEAARFDRATLARQSAFINAQLADRHFSWSALLDHLESAVPDDVRLVRLSPSADERAPGVFRLNIGGRSRTPDGMVELIENLIAHPRFEAPFPQSETTETDGSRTFTLSVRYLPEATEAVR